MAQPIIIKKLKNLKRLGVIDDFTSGPDVPDFKKRNLIYGFNGSGKTILSRVFRSLEKGRLNKHLPADGSFEIELDDNTLISESSNLNRLEGQVIVFNSDFIWENLSWSEHSVNKLFYLGEAQKRAAALLVKADARLERREILQAKKQKENSRRAQEYGTFKTDKARIIAKAINKDRSYKAPDVENAYKSRRYQSVEVASSTKLDALEKIVRRRYAKPEIASVDLEIFDQSQFIEICEEICARSVATVALEELQQHPKMRNWMEEGLTYHSRNELTNCLFCTNPVSPLRFAALEECLNDAARALSSDIRAARDQVDEFKIKAKLFRAELPDSQEMADDLATDYEGLKAATIEKIGHLLGGLNIVKEGLGTKQSDPSLDVKITDVTGTKNISSEIYELASRINALIQSHNKKSQNFETEKKQAEQTIESSYLHEFESRFLSLHEEVRMVECALAKIDTLIVEARSSCDKVRSLVQQHRVAADKINVMLHAYLGHSELRLEANDQGYHIFRHDKLVEGTLSEGEKTALALCYFFAKIEENGKTVKDWIIVIDDPISSLDSKALNYAFNLIRIITEDAAQLIVLTHNIHFMNETKKWLNHSKKRERSLLMIESYSSEVDGDRSSKLLPLDSLLEKYDSEYHYHFKLANGLSKAAVGEEVPYLYVMPNVLRKVLETFLAFKVPSTQGLMKKVNEQRVREAVGDENKVMALGRLVELESHGDSVDNLISLCQMQTEETKDAAIALMTLIEKMDKDHFDSLLEQLNPTATPQAGR